MFRTMTSDVKCGGILSISTLLSAVSRFVANGHQSMHHVSCDLSKIPYVGFSPVRLQTGIQHQPSLKCLWFKCEIHIRHIHLNLYDVKAIIAEFYSSNLCLGITSNRFTMAIQSRGPWLAKGLCCPFGSLLTMASSEALASFCCLIFFVQQVFALRFRMGWMREIPQFTLRICNFVPSSVPRRLSQVQTVVPSLRVLAFAFSVEAQQSAFLCRRFSHRRVTRLQSSR